MLVLTYRSADGEEGFPGEVDAELTYEWTDNATLQMRYHAITDKDTIVNLSNHCYFNLSGEGADSVLDHELRIAAAAVTPVNDMQIPLGTVTQVDDTPFDFQQPEALGARIQEKSPQLSIGKGYDMNYLLDGVQPAVQLSSPRSGIRLRLSTDRPGLQLYSGNHLDGSRRGKSGRAYRENSAVALEPQGVPDAIHHPQFPSVVLKPGEVFYTVSTYEFSTV
jgi:aldose 1-epimerase